MTNVLGPEARGLLAAFAWSRSLLALDFDGTLAPIVSQPHLAGMRRSTRTLLSQASRLYPSVVISGRSVGDLRPRVRGLGLKGVVGDQGAEPFRAFPGVHARVREWTPVFAAALSGEQGVRLEKKAYSLAVHLRQAGAKARVRRIVKDVAGQYDGIRLIEGKEVVHVVPLDAPHKGIALERERARLRCDTAIYVGDDETDEDVFALDQPGRLLAVRVGHKAGSRAAFHLRSQRDIDPFLRRLIRLRQAYHGLSTWLEMT